MERREFVAAMWAPGLLPLQRMLGAERANQLTQRGEIQEGNFVTTTERSIAGPIKIHDVLICADDRPRDAASRFECYRGNELMLSLGLNYRASFRWVPSPEELERHCTIPEGQEYRVEQIDLMENGQKKLDWIVATIYEKL